MLAALQRIGRRPPPALIASPEDALQSVRTAMMLGAVLPEMRREVEALANDLADLLAVRKEIAAERDRLNSDVASLGGERTRMTALVDERQKKQTEREKALEAERPRAAELARQVDNLKDLIAKLEQGLDRGDRGPRARRRAGQRGPRWRPCTTPGRLAPAVAFASLRGQVPIPVNGVEIQGIWRSRRHRRGGKGRFHRHPRRRPGHRARRWLGGLCRTVPSLRPTLDP